MTWTDGVSLAVGLFASVIAYLTSHGRRQVARELAAQRLEQQEAQRLADKQEDVTAEQIRAGEADKDRQSREFWQFVGEINADRSRQDARITDLQTEMRDLRADLDQVRHIEREQRAKVARLTNENLALGEQVTRLTQENAMLHRRVAELEKRQGGGQEHGAGEGEASGTPT